MGTQTGKCLWPHQDRPHEAGGGARLAARLAASHGTTGSRRSGWTRADRARVLSARGCDVCGQPALDAHRVPRSKCFWRNDMATWRTRMSSPPLPTPCQKVGSYEHRLEWRRSAAQPSHQQRQARRIFTTRTESASKVLRVLPGARPAGWLGGATGHPRMSQLAERGMAHRHVRHGLRFQQRTRTASTRASGPS